MAKQFNWKKQLVDQTAHLLIGAAGTWLLMGFFPARQGILLACILVAIREYKQGISARWWDSPMDWFFWTAGIINGAALYHYSWPKHPTYLLDLLF